MPPRAVERLRRAGCVFAEQEAAVLVAAAAGSQGSARSAPERAAALEDLLQRRVAGAPLEHLVGWVDFGRLRLAVGPGAFVPRQRSRALAGQAVAVARRSARPVVVEMCAGVAPIAAAVAHALPHAEVHAADVDPVPLALAARNLLPPGRVHCGPLLDALPADLRGRVDVMAAVPPYVPEPELRLLPREAREHEPAHALTGGVDGLELVRALVVQGQRWLAPGGALLLELGVRQVPSTAALARSEGWQVRGTRRHGTTGVLSLVRPTS